MFTSTIRFDMKPTRFLALALVLLSATAAHAQSAGWRITARDTTWDGTTLLEVTSDSLRFAPEREIIGLELHSTIALAELRELRRGQISGALVGAIPGATLGVVGWLAGGTRTYGDQWFTEGESYLILGGLGAVAGAIVGAIVDKGDTVVELDGRSDLHKREAIARIILFDHE
jgi:hypothetical protein